MSRIPMDTDREGCGHLYTDNSYTDSDPVELGAAQTVEACFTQAWLGRRCRIANAV